MTLEQTMYESHWGRCARCKARRPLKNLKDGSCEDLVFCTMVAKPLQPLDNVDQLVQDLEKRRE